MNAYPEPTTNNIYCPTCSIGDYLAIHGDQPCPQLQKAIFEPEGEKMLNLNINVNVKGQTCPHCGKAMCCDVETS